MPMAPVSPKGPIASYTLAQSSPFHCGELWLPTLQAYPYHLSSILSVHICKVHFDQPHAESFIHQLQSPFSKQKNEMTQAVRMLYLEECTFCLLHFPEDASTTISKLTYTFSQSLQTFSLATKAKPEVVSLVG
jgi:hypothetical protein